MGSGQSIQEDSELGMVYANALYVDEESRLFLADHGSHKTGLSYGAMQGLEHIPCRNNDGRSSRSCRS